MEIHVFLCVCVCISSPTPDAALRPTIPAQCNTARATTMEHCCNVAPFRCKDTHTHTQLFEIIQHTVSDVRNIKGSCFRASCSSLPVPVRGSLAFALPRATSAKTSVCSLPRCLKPGQLFSRVAHLCPLVRERLFRRGQPASQPAARKKVH